ncbi:MAG: hypothetical protein ACK5N8_03860 [Alphaproteobacteria bacterium]
MKKILVVGNFPAEVRTFFEKHKDFVFLHDSHEFDNGDGFFQVVQAYDGAIVFEVSPFALALVDEFSSQSKPILFRNSYYDSTTLEKIGKWRERASGREIFFKELSFFDSAPIYDAIHNVVVRGEQKIRRINLQKSFLKNGNLSEIAKEYLYCLDVILRPKTPRTEFTMSMNGDEGRIEGKSGNVDYSLQIDFSDEVKEEIIIFFQDGTRITTSGNRISFVPKQGKVQHTDTDTDYTRLFGFLLTEFTSSFEHVLA